MDFNTLSVLDNRYAKEAKPLLPYFTENAFVEYLKKVELAVLNQHCKRHGLKTVPSTHFKNIKAYLVQREEETTHHQIRALVNLMQSKLDDKRASFVHLGLTSSDVQDTANILRIRDAFRYVIAPKILDLLMLLTGKMSKYRMLPQIGRTHGQYAIPMTFGWWWAEYVSRIGQAYERICTRSPACGQLSGAIGTYDAMSHLYENPLEFEESVLEELQLRRAEYSSQIMPADQLVSFLGEINICFGVLANLADDLRNLQRSEIDEVREEFTDGQVGSSTMPHKRNPWNSEHVKSLWKAFTPRYLTFCMDLVSEHQRDLTNSASSRFIVEYLTGFYLAVVRTIKTIESLQVNEEIMRKRANASQSAERAYILLAEQGIPQAHEIVRRLTIIAQANKIDFEEVLKNSGWWDRIKDRYYEIRRDVSQDLITDLLKKYRWGGEYEDA